MTIEVHVSQQGAEKESKPKFSKIELSYTPTNTNNNLTHNSQDHKDQECGYNHIA